MFTCLFWVWLHLKFFFFTKNSILEGNQGVFLQLIISLSLCFSHAHNQCFRNSLILDCRKTVDNMLNAGNIMKLFFFWNKKKRQISSFCCQKYLKCLNFIMMASNLGYLFCQIPFFLNKTCFWGHFHGYGDMQTEQQRHPVVSTKTPFQSNAPSTEDVSLNISENS